MLNATTYFGNSEDNEDDTFPPSNLPYYKEWTFIQVWEFKYNSQGNMQGVVTPSGMF